MRWIVWFDTIFTVLFLIFGITEHFNGDPARGTAYLAMSAAMGAHMRIDSR